MSARDESVRGRRVGLAPYGFGLGICAIAVALAVVSFDPSFEHGQGYEDRPIPLVVGLLVVQTVLYAAACIAARQRPPAFAWVLGVAVASRILLVAAAPIQETDFYRYLWDGKVVAQGLDPYLFSPLEVQRYPVVDPTGSGDDALEKKEALARLVSLEKASEANQTILDRVNHPHYTTIYLPLLELVFAVHGLLVPDSMSLHSQVLAMKALFVVFDIACIFVVAALLRRAGHAPGLVVVYAWCPLVLKEIANSGHADSLPAFLAALAVWFVVSARDDRDAITMRRAVLAGLALGLAVASKLYAIVLLPLLARKAGWRGAFALGAIVLLVVFAFDRLHPDGAENRRATLSVFALFWENYCGIFWWVQKLIAKFDASVVEVHLGSETLVLERSRLIARGVVAGVFGVVLIALASRTRTTTRPEVLIRRVFLSLAALFLLGPLGFPWYFVGCLPFLPFARSRAWLLLPACLAVYYLAFWYEYQYGEPGLEHFDRVVVPSVYGAFYALLVLETAWRWRAKRRRERPGCQRP